MKSIVPNFLSNFCVWICGEICTILRLKISFGFSKCNLLKVRVTDGGYSSTSFTDSCTNLSTSANPSTSVHPSSSRRGHSPGGYRLTPGGHSSSSRGHTPTSRGHTPTSRGHTPTSRSHSPTTGGQRTTKTLLPNQVPTYIKFEFFTIFFCEIF